jgi:hypothetical protein
LLRFPDGGCAVSRVAACTGNPPKKISAGSTIHSIFSRNLLKRELFRALVNQR